MSGILWLVPLSGIVAVIAAAMLARDVLGRPKGTPEMQEVAAAIYEGAMAFLNRQYRTIAMLSVVAAAAVRRFAWTEIHMPTKPAMAEHAAPTRNATDVRQASSMAV